jgi:hypothetical protein
MYCALPLSGRQDDGRASSLSWPTISNGTDSQALNGLVACGADPAFLTTVLAFCRRDPVAQRLWAL